MKVEIVTFKKIFNLNCLERHSYGKDEERSCGESQNDRGMFDIVELRVEGRIFDTLNAMTSY